MRPIVASRQRAVWVLVAALAVALPALAHAQDSIRASQFDLGKMWTFEKPPAEYFTATYGFPADSAWFARARLAALRIPGCSAGLVSADGLIVTNHHCIRSRLASIARPGETLLDSGFVALTLADERRIPDYHADQLIAAIDVTDQLEASGAARRTAEDRLRARLLATHGSPGDSTWIQFVDLYDGARTSAYVFRRLTDIRFVMAVELQMGFFGGDPDNFTYPRYALDFAVLRAYGADGRPLATPSHFAWGGNDGVREGEVVFVIGNPGRTARLTTIAQLEYARDVSLPVSVHFLRSRIEAMRAYLAAEPEEAERIDLRNRIFSLSNREKSAGGRLEALHDATVLARRGDSEKMLRDSLRLHTDLEKRYGAVFDRLAELTRERRALATETAAFSEFLNATGGSGTLQRAWWAWRLTQNPGDAAASYRERFASAPSWPAGLERQLLVLQLGDVARAYGPGHAVTRALLNGATPEEAADRLMASSGLTGAAGTVNPDAVAGDPAVRLVGGVGAALLAFQGADRDLAAHESGVAADLGRARYAVYGDAIPPDGSFSPRIADGTVQGYSYNGTLAPAWTTFFGIYDRNRSFGNGTDWTLPGRWRTPPAGLDLGTPLNFASTADTYGGNSGSPAVTRDLRLVGLNFDRNINALVRDYLYLPERGRNIMVDARAIEAALGGVYGLERIVAELHNGRLASSPGVR